MAIEKVSEQARRHIRENDQRAAADLLMQAFRDKNQQLFNIAVVQQANIKKLADQSAAGILSVDEINREQAKTNAALLHLSDEYARLYETKTSTQQKKIPWWAYGIGVLLVAAVLFYRFISAAPKVQIPETTTIPKPLKADTTVYEAGLRDAKGRPIANAQVTIDGALHANTDTRGYFKVAIPKAGGATVFMEIEKEQKRLFKQEITISSGYHEIPIE